MQTLCKVSYKFFLGRGDYERTFSLAFLVKPSITKEMFVKFVFVQDFKDLNKIDRLTM